MKAAVLVLKLAITASICAWLYARIDLPNLRESLARLGVLPIVAGVLLHLLVVFLSASRWWLLLTRTGTTTPFLKVFPSYYLGVFFNNFMPTGLGGDAVRVLHLRGRGVSTNSLVSASVVDRIIGLATIFTIGTIGALVADERFIPGSTKSVLVAVFAGCVLAAAWTLSGGSGRLLESIGEKYRDTRIRRWLLDVVRTCYSFRTQKTYIVLAMAISVSAHSSVIATYYLLGRGLGLDIPVTTYIVTLPVVFFVASLPISIGGLGVREGALVGMLVTVGAEMQLAINLSLVYLLVFWFASLPGAFVLLFGRAGTIVRS